MKKNRCMNCNMILITEQSKLKNKCSFCRQIFEIKNKRLSEWNNFLKNANDIPNNFVKRTVILNLYKNKNNFLKFGNMSKYQ